MNDNATIIGHIIDGDAWLPVTFDGTAYTVDLGGAQGTSDPIAIDGDARDVLEAIAAELSDEYGRHVGYVMRDGYTTSIDGYTAADRS